MVTAKGRVEVTVTHPDGKVDDGYYVEALARGEADEQIVKLYADEFALCAALVYMQPREYTDLALDDTEFRTTRRTVH
jgi:hypothetical protein